MDRRLAIYEADPAMNNRLYMKAAAFSTPQEAFHRVTALPAAAATGAGAFLTDPVDGAIKFYVWNGNQWIRVGERKDPYAVFSDTAPLNPIHGKVWYQTGTSDKVLHGIRVYDSPSKSWVNTEPERVIDQNWGPNDDTANENSVLFVVKDASKPDEMVPFDDVIYGQFRGFLTITGDPAHSETPVILGHMNKNMDVRDFTDAPNSIEVGTFTNADITHAMNTRDAPTLTSFVARLTFIPMRVLPGMMCKLSVDVWYENDQWKPETNEFLYRVDTGKMVLQFNGKQIEYITAEGSGIYHSDEPPPGGWGNDLIPPVAPKPPQQAWTKTTVSLEDPYKYWVWMAGGAYGGVDREVEINIPEFSDLIISAKTPPIDISAFTVFLANDKGDLVGRGEPGAVDSEGALQTRYGGWWELPRTAKKGDHFWLVIGPDTGAGYRVGKINIV